MDIRKAIDKGNLATGVIFLLLLWLTYYIYSLGSGGAFLFDDFNNLSPLGQYENLGFWDNFWLFLLEGHSGPTGRPISLASFYLNDTHWPSQAVGFIHTNILIHLLNGALVFWFSLQLSKILHLEDKKKALFALITTAFWLLNPMQTTTVLYIVQRMTELSATFMLTGFLFYLYGRKQLSDSKPKGYLTLFLGVGLSLLFAILSKENGILLVAFILVIEFFLLQPLNNKTPKGYYFWFIPAIIIPFIAMIIYLGVHINPDGFSHRNFTFTERLLTEPRVLFEYIHQILLPNMSSITIFHDDFIISKSLLNPITTVPALVGIAILVILLFYLRKKAPIISFAIAWFFAGHLIESTVIPLELYFEHRNYLPSYGLFFALVWYAFKYLPNYKKTIIVIACSLLVFNTLIVWQNAKLWGTPLELAMNWYKTHPSSERARRTYQSISYDNGIKPILIKTTKHRPKNRSIFYTASVMFDLSAACLSQTISTEMLDRSIKEIKNNLISTSTASSLKSKLKFPLVLLIVPMPLPTKPILTDSMGASVSPLTMVAAIT